MRTGIAQVVQPFVVDGESEGILAVVVRVGFGTKMNAGFPYTCSELFAHHPMTLRSRKNFPLNVCGASVASHTAVSAPSSTDRAALAPPISVRTHPGHIA